MSTCSLQCEDCGLVDGRTEVGISVNRSSIQHSSEYPRESYFRKDWDVFRSVLNDFQVPERQL